MKGFVYSIRDLNSDKIYIGSSCKLRLTDRISDHLYSYKIGKPINSRLIFDGGNWESEIIDTIDDVGYKKLNLLLMEQAWMDEMQFNYDVVNGARAVGHRNKYLACNKIKI
jgi:hypothetical protein